MSTYKLHRFPSDIISFADHVFPLVPVRQWVMAFPKRLRWFLHRDPAVLSAVLRIVLRPVECGLRKSCPGAPAGARFAAVTFVQRFGSSLNAHTHFHCCIADGVFSACDGELRFHPATDLTSADVAVVQELIRARVLRYCARPALAGARLSWEDGTKQRVRYTFSRPAHDGRSMLVLRPLEVLDRLSTLIPPPRRHRRAAYLWAQLLARVYECFPLACTHCRAEMRVIGFITAPNAVRRILTHIAASGTS